MNITLINSLYYPNIIGGAEKSVQLLAESLAATGDEVSVITTSDVTRDDTVNGVRVHYLSAPNLYWMPTAKSQPSYKKPIWHVIDSYNGFVRRRVRRILEREKPDVLHTNNLAGLSVSVWGAGIELGIPIIHTIRDHYLLCARGLMYHAGKVCDRQCLYCSMLARPRRRASSQVNAAVGLSRFMLEKHERFGFFNKASLKTYIYNSVAANQTAQPKKRPAGEIVFGYVGQLAPAKGIEFLLKRFQRMNFPGARLLVFGRALDTAYEERLKAAYAGHSIEFLGFRDTAEIYPRLDVAVIPSLCDDALTRTVTEANSYGIPVIATSRGGVGELVIDGETGYLFDPDSTDQLEDRIRRFVDEPKLVESFSPHCLKQAAQFSGPMVAERYREVYRTVLEQHRTRRIV